MTGPLVGQRILIVEDEYYIAADLRRMLADAGVEVVGPVGKVDAAIALADGEPLDAALLDVNLDGTMSFPIADWLATLGVPYAFLTGYDGWALPETYQGTPRIAKPFTKAAVLDCVARLCAKEMAQ